MTNDQPKTRLQMPEHSSGGQVSEDRSALTRVSRGRLKKESLVTELSEKVAKAKAIVFANYQGMTHIQLEQLKKGLKKLESELVVAKNTLLTRALKDMAPKDQLQGPTATLFAYNDVVLPLKELAKSIKNIKLPQVKLGILDGKAITADQVLKLATLPPRNVLIAQVVGGMKTPLYGLHRALSWNLQRLVLILNAIQKTKQG